MAGYIIIGNAIVLALNLTHNFMYLIFKRIYFFIRPGET